MGFIEAKVGLGVLLAAIVLAPGQPVLAAVVRVSPLGDDSRSGDTWENSKRTITAALASALAGDEIWVADGTYPEHLANRVSAGVAIDVALYGGFSATETSRDQRDPRAHPTVIDGSGTGICVTITDGAGPATRVDGFVITGGLGGIRIVGSAPVVENNVIRANRGPGVAVHKYQILQIAPPVVAHPRISRNQIVDNVAANGGGIAITGDLLTNLVPAPPTAPTIAGNVVARNTATQNGGGIGCWGHTAPVIEGNYVLANSASTYEPGWDGDDPVGPWLVGGGGIFATKSDMAGQPLQYAIAAPSIRNNVVAANGALLGGGICLIDYPRLSAPNNPPPVVTNNTVVANNGSGIFWGNTFPTVVNNVVAYNTWGLQQGAGSEATVQFNDVYGNQVQGIRTDYQGLADQTGSNGNLCADPRFARFGIGEVHLQPTSPCIDAGSAAAVGDGWTDLDGDPRIIGPAVDLGADESAGTLHDVPWPVVYVRPGGSDALAGSTWATAKQTVAAGIAAAAATGGDVWVAEGTYVEHVQVPPFVYLYGGFAGTETALNQRDVGARPTVLDGGGVPTVVLSKNAGYLVSALDGFTVRNGGVHRGNVVPQWNWGVEGRGGGIRSVVTGLYVRNNLITRNSLGNPFDNANRRAHGAGIHGYLSHSVVAGNTITENEILNTFDGSGGGVYFKLSMPTIERNILAHNHARYASAVHCLFSIPRIAGNTIDGNAMYDTYPLPLYFGSVDGAVTLDAGEDFLVEGNIFRGNRAGTGAGLNVKTNLAGRIRNNLFLDNVAYDPTAFGGMGGGLYALVLSTNVEHHYILNNTFVRNTATYAGLPPPMNEQGGGMAVSLPVPVPPPATMPPGKLAVANNVLAGNSSGIFQTTTAPMLAFTLEYNDFYNLGVNYRDVTPGGTDISADPLFVDAAAGNYRLRPTSPCVDAGVDRWGLGGLTDLDAAPRVADGDADGVAAVDLGAYEFPLPDADGDGVADFSDAFPADPAASVDADGDGFPESWNSGKTAADSTTGLVLDVYPGDPSRAFPIAALSGVPPTPTALVRATVTVAGRDITAYRYRLDGSAWSAKRSVALPIALAGLSQGSHTLDVLGRDGAGNWQPVAWATQATWRVNFGFLDAVKGLLLER